MTTHDMAFELHFEQLGCCGRFVRMAGLSGELTISVGSETRDLIRFEDGKLESNLLRWATGRTRWKWEDAGNANIVLLNKRGEPMGAYFFGIGEPLYQHGVGEDGQVTELALVGALPRPALPEALSIWARWRDGGPTELNEWAPLSFHQRRAWLEVVCHAHRHGDRRKRSCSTYDLDGRFMTDYPSAFLAIGEAINGPGGYFGRSLDALSDCLRGGYGADRLVTLRWHDMDIARQHLSKDASRREVVAGASHESLFDGLMHVFADLGIQVVSA